MPKDAPSTPRVPRSASSVRYIFAFGLVVVFFVVSAVVAYTNARTLRLSARQVSHSHEVIGALEDVFTLLKDAETGQRGFILTGNERYLEPYNAALPRIDSRMVEVQRLTADNPAQQARIPTIKEQIAAKLAELSETIELRRRQGLDAALAVVQTDRGKGAMDALRAQVASMEDDEHKLLDARFQQTEVAFATALQSAILTGVVGIVLAGIVMWMLRHGAIVRARQEWLRTGQSGLSEKLVGVQSVPEVSETALQFLSEYLEAKAGAIFVEENGAFRRSSTYAVPAAASLPERIVPGEGLLGQAAKNAKPYVVREVPDGYLSIGSALGNARPRHLLIAAAAVDGKVNAVLELGFFDEIDATSIEFLDRCAESIGIAVRTAQSRARIVELLEETQRQAEELQAQSEELRVSNEELEEQSRVLKQTHSQLEEQQVELEQSNVQLKEQTALLEMQKENLTKAKLDLERQAHLVEQASRYKSDFLANMSHELRTPLNSSLILAQLLAENRGGNLTDEQIKYAQTIKSSGNDLLALINDVLDLSKIEAGRMDIRPQRVGIEQLLGTLRGQFEPMANNRGLRFDIRVGPAAPPAIETDQQRLEQVLRNLISNALKFTEKGEVVLEINNAGPGRISFAVIDTGIGIDPSQQRLIFEPFCQADGTTSRKYGGTGLGLSISRELAHLLGGEIHLTSQPGRGSIFKVTIPETLSSAVVLPAPAPTSVPPPPSAPTPTPAPPAKTSSPKVADDREHLNPAQRVILIVEDDPRFAEVLASLGHEHNFQCILTASAPDALELARQYSPSAVVLDVALVDGSGLFVLERLKHDARTRHIPVHVVSGSDYAEKALALGAIGYMLKPVPREQLSEAFRSLEAQLTRRLRRVLVVEDDEVQRGALCKLLGSPDVETIGAQDAADCLQQLKAHTVDCMVLDLSLPDASGFTLLEKLSADDSYPFPPVIIYTGRELSTDEEQRLRRYSKSIIIKGAKSPERLLDEVALFLHQVVSELPAEQQRMIEKARSRDAALEGRRILLAEDDVRNVFALTSLLEPLGLSLEIARNGLEAIAALDRAREGQAPQIDLVLMDIMMPEMDGLTAMREIRQRPEWKKVPIIALTAKAMPNDQEQCLEAGASDYLAKPLDVEKLLSLVRVWMPR
ncbi:MAG TPA: response regulator [Chthoniobacter sp.]|nr:response regulator [Chthoniobacter sp.]